MAVVVGIMGVDSYLQFLSVLIIFILVLVATYYVTKWISNYQKDVSSGKNIQVIETAKISATKYVQIVKIGGRYVAIGVSKDQIVNLGEVDGNGLIFDGADTQNLGFKEIFEKIKGEKKK